MTAENEVAAVNALICKRTPDSQRRIDVIARILRDLLDTDEGGDAELAFTLVVAERWK